MLTWFLAQLGASNTLIGFVQPLRFGASFLLQLSFSGYVERQPYKHPLYRTISIFRCLVLLAFAAVVAVVPVESPWLVAAFFVALTLYSLGAGLVSIPFMDVVGKVVPPRRRGVFFGRAMFSGRSGGTGRKYDHRVPGCGALWAYIPAQRGRDVRIGLGPYVADGVVVAGDQGAAEPSAGGHAGRTPSPSW